MGLKPDSSFISTKTEEEERETPVTPRVSHQVISLSSVDLRKIHTGLFVLNGYSIACANIREEGGSLHHLTAFLLHASSDLRCSPPEISYQILLVNILKTVRTLCEKPAQQILLQSPEFMRGVLTLICSSAIDMQPAEVCSAGIFSLPAWQLIISNSIFCLVKSCVVFLKCLN